MNGVTKDRKLIDQRNIFAKITFHPVYVLIPFLASFFKFLIFYVLIVYIAVL